MTDDKIIRRIREQVVLLDREFTIGEAQLALELEPVSITDRVSPESPGTPNDYYSNGDYWWPDPSKPDGLPYIRRDGLSNPNFFSAHRTALRRLRTQTARLASAYKLTGEEKYAKRAVQGLKRFFLEPATRMNPHLLYAQAIPGVCTGRGIGIIDTLHLIDVPYAIEALKQSPALDEETEDGLRNWFAQYLQWMSTHPYGIDEMNTDNNHSVCWFVQAAVFARFTGDEEMLAFCRERYKKVILPSQMQEDGSFPRELGRTKPYGYSIFVLDNMATLCHVLSTPEDNLWTYELEDGRGIGQGFQFLYPYMEDKRKWPYGADVEHFEGWPARIAGLLFASAGLSKPEYFELWSRLDANPSDDEIRRNIAIREPLLWLI
ncbi:alginate lyase family protein [Paenibacillus thalictri]|uniref:Alginate lyase n=1 Tax=Paenibacillus thalictri TaxID=2527873 RepID=A0A4Q9DS09_9BACL|nr:alginate lyase family protein [Paenibacillus thalictri]TBL78514.1 alginate lyase [Paenibacillus thalictri]